MEGNPASLGRTSPGATFATILKGFVRWAHHTVGPRKTRRLRVRETLSLGDKRFLAVIEFDRQEFLVGGSGNSLALLARLQEGMVTTDPPLPTDPRSA